MCHWEKHFPRPRELEIQVIPGAEMRKSRHQELNKGHRVSGDGEQRGPPPPVLQPEPRDNKESRSLAEKTLERGLVLRQPICTGPGPRKKGK